MFGNLFEKDKNKVYKPIYLCKNMKNLEDNIPKETSIWSLRRSANVSNLLGELSLLAGTMIISAGIIAAGCYTTNRCYTPNHEEITETHNSQERYLEQQRP